MLTKRNQFLVWLLVSCAVAGGQPGNPTPDNIATNLPAALKALIAEGKLGLSVNRPESASVETNGYAYAAIYTTQLPTPLAPILASLDPSLKISERTNGVVCTWPDVNVRFKVDTHWDGLSQRGQMKNWMLAVDGTNASTPAVAGLLRQVDGTVGCIVAITTPGYDAGGKASGLVRRLAARFDGYVLSEKAFYSATGEKIVGMTNSPAEFK